MPAVAAVQSPGSWIDALSRLRISISGGPNFIYDLCSTRIPPEKLEGLDLSSWRAMINGSEIVSPATLKHFCETFGGCGVKPENWAVGYGMTEASCAVSFTSLERAPDVIEPIGGQSDGTRRGPAVSCGTPLTGQEVTIVHPDDASPCAPGEEGEVWLAG